MILEGGKLLVRAGAGPHPASSRTALVMRFQLNCCNSSIRARLNVSIPATIAAAPPKKNPNIDVGTVASIVAN